MDSTTQNLCDAWRHMMLDGQAKHGILPSHIVVGVTTDDYAAAKELIDFNHKNRWCLAASYRNPSGLVELTIFTNDTLPECEDTYDHA